MKGIEGRGSSAVGSLLDAMLHPGADQGLDLDPLIEWRCHKRIDHVVIGKGPPGGAWQVIRSSSEVTFNYTNSFPIYRELLCG